MARTAIVVPCFNEEQRLDGAAFLDAVARDPRTEFVFVNDGSRDRTLDRLRELAARCPGRIRWCDLPENRGKAEAVRRGVCTALRDGAEYVGYWDADLATPLDEIPRFREVLDRRPEVQVVIGTRLPLLGRKIVRKRSRRFLGRVFARVASRMVELPLIDTQCGAKLFRATTETERLFAEPFLSRWIFDVELFARMAALRGRAAAAAIYELPLENWHDVAGSKLKGRDFVRAIGELAAIRWRYFAASGRGRIDSKLTVGESTVEIGVQGAGNRLEERRAA